MNDTAAAHSSIDSPPCKVVYFKSAPKCHFSPLWTGVLVCLPNFFNLLTTRGNWWDLPSGFADRWDDLKLRRQSFSKTLTTDRNWQKKRTTFCDATTWKRNSDIFPNETGERLAKTQAKKRQQYPPQKASLVVVHKNLVSKHVDKEWG